MKRFEPGPSGGVAMPDRTLTHPVSAGRCAVALWLALMPAMASAAISGTVFRDFNQNGTLNTGDAGIQGIVVRAYNAGGTLVATATTGATGTYSLATTAGAYRLEFERYSFLESAGGTNSTVIRFANDGATGVNVALANPVQYCEAETYRGLSLPRVTVAQFAQGQRVPLNSNRALGSYAFNITPTVAAAAESADLDAIVGDVGAVWAVAHHRRSNYMLLGSFFRRHAELGPGRGAGTTNTGVIYVVDPGTSGTTANTAKVFADINQIAGSNIAGSNLRPNPVSGTYNFFHDPGTGGTTASAVDIFRSVGKIGLGGMDTSDDGNTLYVVNLGDRRLYQLDTAVLNSRPSLATPTTPVLSSFKNPSVPIPNSVCANPVDARPFAARFHDGYLYVGVTCTAESTIPLLAATATSGTTSRGDRTQLRGLVWRFNPSTQSFDDPPGLPANPVVNIRLDYPRGCIQPVQFAHGLPNQTVANSGGACNPTGAGIDSRGIWNPWQPNWQVIYSEAAVTPQNIQNDPFYLEYPQPLLSDLEFDATGAMILAIRDINGDKVGYCAGSPNLSEGTAPTPDAAYPNCLASGTTGNPAGTHRGNAEGDLLRACGNSVAGWTLESGGSCGGVTANNPLPTVGGTPPQNGQGPGNGEFYWGDSGPSGLDSPLATGGNGLGYVTGQNGHGEILSGSIALVPNPQTPLTSGGTAGNWVVGTMIDARGYYDGGLLWFNNATGQSAKRIRVYDENITTGGKSGGLGDMEMMCTLPPTQVGNRVWNDADGDGIQDANETGISGVTVEIWSTANALLGRTTTNAAGEWYMSFAVGATDPSNTDASIILADPYDTSYRVYLPQSQTGGAGSVAGTVAPLLNFTASPPTADTTPRGTERDSNGTTGFDPDGAGGQLPRIGATFTLGGPGIVNHSLDFGFRDDSAVTTSVNLGVTIDDGVTTCGGTPRVYNVVVTNPAAGSAATTGVPFSVTYPSNVTPASWTCAGAGGATCSAASGSGNPGGVLSFTSMPINSNVTVAITVNESPICSNATGNVVLQANVPQRWGSFEDTNMTNNVDDDVDVPGGDLSITLSSTSSLYCPGQTSVYTLTVSNAGPATASNVSVAMALPDPPFNPGLTSWSRSGGLGTVVSGSSGTAPALSSVVTLASGQSVVYTVQAYVRSSFDAPSLTATATLTTPAGWTDSASANNSASDTDNYCGGPPVSTSFCAAPGQDGVPATPISGVVNTYWAGATSSPAAGTSGGGGGCASGTVALSVEARAGAATNVAVGDLLLLIQMQGASIDSTDSANYGDGSSADAQNAGGVSNLNDVGRYEFVRAAAVNTATGATTLCVNGAGANSGLLRQYDHNLATAPRRTWQVVRVPQYSNVTLSNTTAVTPLAWDGRRGGIVALDVQNQLSFNTSGQINADALGFRGGVSASRAGGGTSASNTAYAAAAAMTCHGDKGEGIAGTPSTITGFGVDYPGNGAFARGAPGNAGGGGNDANCTSAGGANQDGGGGGGAACGRGGFGGTSQNNSANAPGRGGGEFDGALSDLQLLRNRLLMGGGGGAGSRDTATARAGGAGGGIVILRAGSIVGVGTLNANGGPGATGGADADGGGGGGGGGSVVILTNPVGPSNLSSITINADGGVGGATTGTNARGSGGGGGGGCFLSSALAGQLPSLTGVVDAGAGGTQDGAGTDGVAGQPGRAASGLAAVDGNSGAQPGYVCGAALVPVTLSRVLFQDMGAGRVRAAISTASQVGTLGFNVYGTASDGRRLRLNAMPYAVAESTSLTPQDYQFDLDGLGLTSFMLEEVDTKGQGTLYGPYELGREYGARPDVRAVDWTGIRNEVAQARARQAASLLARRGAGGVEVEVRVAADGVHRIRHEDLLAIGVNWSGVPSSDLSLTLDERVQALRRVGGASFGPGSAIEFVGTAVQGSLYTRQQVYRLRNTGGSPDVAELSASVSSGGRTQVRGASVAEQNVYYGIDAPGADPWYLQRVTRVGNSTVGVDIPLTLNDYAPSSGERLTLRVWGGLDYPGQGDDHALEVQLNGQTLGSLRFDGVNERDLSVDLPAGLARAGANTVRVNLLPTTGFDTDRINIESVRIEHDRLLVARAGRLAFDSGSLADDGGTVASADSVLATGFEAGESSACPAGSTRCASYALSGFGAQAEIWRLRAAGVERLRGQWQDGSLRFQALEARGDRYLILEPAAGVLPELSVAAEIDSSLLQGPADYLALVHPSFLDGAGRAALDQLLARWESEGLRTKIVDVEQVYRRYSGGRIDPTAIDRYLGDATLAMGLRYVLLVGGDSYDHLNHLGLGTLTFIPTPYGRTHDFVNYAPLDSRYADLDGDGLIDLALGRLPVRTAAELSSLTQKILAFENAPHQRSSLMIADRTGADGLSFRSASENFAISIAAGWALPTEVFLDRYASGNAGTAAARSDISAAVNSGRALTTFVGHSAPGIWSRERLLDAGQVQSGLFSNANLPTLVTQFGCWGAYYSVPQYNTMAHALLLGSGGASGVIGASGLTATASDELMGLTLLPRMTQSGVRVGDALLGAKQEIRSRDPAAVDVLMGTHLLGDPAMRLNRQ